MRSVRRGRGTEVAGSRPYRPGDDIRSIDWGASARMSSARGADEFVVRERYADEGPRVVVVDWQTVTLGPGPSDLAYLLGASLLPDVRRAEERGLVARYVAGLRGLGVTVDEGEVWDAYRGFAFGGLVMAIVAQALVRRTDRGDEMFITMADRHSRQAVELDSESLLP